MARSDQPPTPVTARPLNAVLGTISTSKDKLVGIEMHAPAGVLDVFCLAADVWVVDQRPPRMMLAGPVVVEECVSLQQTVHEFVVQNSCISTSPVSTHTSDIMMRKPRPAQQPSIPVCMCLTQMVKVRIPLWNVLLGCVIIHTSCVPGENVGSSVRDRHTVSFTNNESLAQESASRIAGNRSG